MQHKQTTTGQKRGDLYQQVTDYVIDALERGVIMWRKPWGKLKGKKPTFPLNLSTGYTYTGWNLFTLSWVMQVCEYQSPYFVTFKQVQEMGGRILKGSHGTQLIRCINKADNKKPAPCTDEAAPTAEAEEKKETHTILVPFTVFNVAQTEGITYPEVNTTTYSEPERLTVCEGIISGMPQLPRIEHGGDRAAYSRGLDRIVMPLKAAFDSMPAYYSTLFHELVHSTGHEKRLNRKELIDHDGFGGENYSREELTAEFGAAYLSAHAGIELSTIDSSAAYIDHWLNKLRRDKTLIVRAAAQAQKAADYIMGLQAGEPVATA